MEIIYADIYARYKKMHGYEVFFNTGTDEHGQKIYEKALESGKPVQTYVDEYAEEFKHLQSELFLSLNINFIRTTDKHHTEAAREFWLRCKASDDIYKKKYVVRYCVGCELEKTDSELESGRCPLHPDKKLQFIEEENYFFRFSKYGGRLLKLYEANPDFVVPAFRLNEMKSFIERGLEDFSVSRLKSKMPWGVDVPDDPEHVMYVWFDALASYISAIGWPDDEKKFKSWWPVVQFAGKDQVRQQAAMWQAMLMSAQLPPSKQIVIHGFITVGGQKMSKSLGNVIRPQDIVSEYGAEALRYYIAREMSPFEDSDFTIEKFKSSYNANLANGIGNITQRILTLAEKYLSKSETIEVNEPVISKEIAVFFEIFEFQKAADALWRLVAKLDQDISARAPYKLVKTDPEGAKIMLKEMLFSLSSIAVALYPFMPETSENISRAIRTNTRPAVPLFPRKD